jgi:two-component system sensor histidine kinase BaeS
MAVAKGIQADLHLEADTLPIRANEARLRRLLLILVDNALKFTPAGGRVTVSGSSDGAEVTIAVADTGTGISPADLPHIFERFWRADRVRSRETGGTGLGLTIARQIADEHNARLDVQSEVGHGSVFTIRFPKAVS